MTIQGDDLSKKSLKIANWYKHFAAHEASGKSQLYERLSTFVQNSTRVIDLLCTLPLEKCQPNLLFAAYRFICGIPQNETEFSANIQKHWEEIVPIILSHSTQTNEASRCATLLPLICKLDQPIALLEVGASAGLCLYPDRYSYDFGRSQIIAPSNNGIESPKLVCTANAKTPIPTSLPSVVWRAGLDLNPLDVNNSVQMDWLEYLIWPEQEARLATLKKAVRMVKQEPSILKKGNLITDLAALAATAPKDATLVVFHSAVLAYVTSEEDKSAFRHTVSSLPGHWISNESPTVFPDIADKVIGVIKNDQFLLSLDGTPVASTGPHGQSINWF
jgi:hypothetical protein